MVRTHSRDVRLSRGRGAAILVFLLLVSMVILSVGLALSFMSVTEVRLSLSDRDHRAAMYVAETGLKQAEDALEQSYFLNKWDDDLDPTNALGRPIHAYDQLPLNLQDGSLNRNGLIVYRWSLTPPPGAPVAPLFQVPVIVRGANARYTVWVRNNSDDYGATVTLDGDNVVKIVSLGEVLDGNGNVKARSFLTETVTMPPPDASQYAQKGLGSGGTSTIDP